MLLFTILIFPLVLFFQIIMVLTISDQDPEQHNMIMITTVILDIIGVVYLYLL